MFALARQGLHRKRPMVSRAMSTGAVVERFVDTPDGVRLYVRSQGTGPPVIMIPGALGTAEVSIDLFRDRHSALMLTLVD